MSTKQDRLLSMVDLSKSDPIARVSTFFDYMRSMPDYQCHDRVLLDAVKLRSAWTSPDDPKIAHTIYDLECIPALCNVTGNLHGGAVALVFDICTSTTIAPVSAKGFWDTGNVSRTLNCTYIRPAVKGSMCTVESEIVHIGARAGMIRGVIKDAEGRVCYTCEHGKIPVDFKSGRYKL